MTLFYTKLKNQQNETVIEIGKWFLLGRARDKEETPR